MFVVATNKADSLVLGAATSTVSTRRYLRPYASFASWVRSLHRIHCLNLRYSFGDYSICKLRSFWFIQIYRLLRAKYTQGTQD